MHRQKNKTASSRTPGSLRILHAVSAVLCTGLVACGGGGGSGNDPDLSGVWVGTWEGTDPFFGRVTGSWEVEVSKAASGVTGVALLGGDVDCAEGTVEGAAGGDRVPRGSLDRSPCPGNQWTMTALDLATRSASGTWTKPETGGSGTFTGTQVATPGGPRIRHFTPQGGPAGTVVTIAGNGMETLTAPDLLFGDVPAAQVLAANADRVVAVVPFGASKGPLFATTPDGLAISPRHFDPGASHPTGDSLTEIIVDAPQEGVVASPDGRRVFLASTSVHDGPAVFMVDTATRTVITATPVPVNAGDRLLALTMSPDGRRVYAACGSSGVAVLHGVTNALVARLSVPSGEASTPNPQGLAVSPDNTLLYVADGRDGGSVRIVDMATRTVVATIAGGENLVPRGIALSPDGELAYFVFSSLQGAGTVRVFETASRAVVAEVPVGSRPIGIALTPDGAALYVSHAFEDAVLVIDTVARSTAGRIPVGVLPQGIAVTPDGRRLLVTNGGGQTMTVVSTVTNQIVTTLPLPGSPASVTVGPDGQRAYVTYADAGQISAWSSDRLILIAKDGTGIGTVTSTPTGLECGVSCRAGFPAGTVLRLSATPSAGSVFDSWGGDPDCRDGVVTLDRDLTCTAAFRETGGGGGNGKSDGSCFVQCLQREVFPPPLP